MGRIRGANAAAAALLRVSSACHASRRSEPALSMMAQSSFEPEVELTEPFYRVLAELNVAGAGLGGEGPGGGDAEPRGHGEDVGAGTGGVREARGERDGRLRAPSEAVAAAAELLALTDPRVVVVGGTRLSEDVENWGAWVARESP